MRLINKLWNNYQLYVKCKGNHLAYALGIAEHLAKYDTEIIELEKELKNTKSPETKKKIKAKINELKTQKIADEKVLSDI